MRVLNIHQTTRAFQLEHRWVDCSVSVLYRTVQRTATASLNRVNLEIFFWPTDKDSFTKITQIPAPMKYLLEVERAWFFQARARAFKIEPKRASSLF